jgi:Mg2+/Co2+ transporter CorB
MPVSVQIGVVVLCLLACAFFSAAEIAFLAANRVRIRHLAEQGSRVARGYLEAFRHPERLLSTAMMGVTIAHVSASAVATMLLQSIGAGRRAALLATVILTPLMLVIGEILPKALAQAQATAGALRLYDPLRAAAWLLTPLVAIANLLVRTFLRGLGLGERRDPFVSRDDLRLLFEAEPTGSTDVREEEREMIEGIFDLVETSVREIMVPLVDVVAVEEVARVPEVVARIQESGRSRLPVYRERIDNVKSYQDPRSGVNVMLITTAGTESLVAEKRQLVAEQNLVGNARGLTHAPSSPAGEGYERFRRLQEINRRLVEFTGEARRRLEDELARTRRQLAANSVWHDRDYAFCLYPAEKLQRFFDYVCSSTVG